MSSKTASAAFVGNAVRKCGRIMMILSPAKTLDFASPVVPASLDNLQLTSPSCNPQKTLAIVMAMKQRSEAQLGTLLGISKNLAKTTAAYWNDFELNPNHEQRNDNANNEKLNNKPCIFAYSGAAYQGLRADECTALEIAYLQENLRIVDAVYGLLRPLDRIQPYRLEMATRNVFASSSSSSSGNNDNGDNEKNIKLDAYWRDSVTKSLREELQARANADNDNEHDEQAERGPIILLNLASDEYASAVDKDGLVLETDQKASLIRYVKVAFLEQGGVVAVHAKRARGLMARYLAQTNAQTLDDVKAFAEEGYRLVDDDNNEEEETRIVFDREKQTKTKKTAVTTKRTSASTTASATTTRKRTKR